MNLKVLLPNDNRKILYETFLESISFQEERLVLLIYN